MTLYNVFISHSWSYDKNYEALVSLLDKADNFFYRNYSVPKNDPIHCAGTDTELREAIRKQMAPASVIIILAGMYAHYSKWINIEIELAKTGFSKPKKIIAVEYWGAERTSRVVKNAADKVVKWQAESIANAIKELS